MHKLKNMVSPNHRKSEDAATDSNLARPAASTPVRNEGEHPIYDQMTSQSPTAPTFSQPSASESHYSSHGHRLAQAESGSAAPPAQQAQRHWEPEKPQASGADDISSNSIKSGVIGYPRSPEDAHAALRHDNNAQKELAADNHLVGRENKPSLAEQGEESVTNPGDKHRNPEHTSQNAARIGDTPPYEQSLSQTSPPSGTERSFPLAGGVRREPHTQPTAPVTSEREPGTKEKEAGVHDGQGREKLADAAAAATPASVVHTSHSEKTTPERPPEVSPDGSGNHDYHPEALAAATAAVSNTRSEPSASHESSKVGNSNLGNQSDTSNKSSHDAGDGFDSNLATPHLHIPGEFPSPTPVDESREPSYLTSKGASSAAAFGNVPRTHQEVRHTGTLDSPFTKNGNSPHDASSRGRSHDGATALGTAGLGAGLGAGAYAAGKRHQESPQTSNDEVFKTAPSPYSSTRIDPRVDSKPLPPTSTQDQVQGAPSTGGARQLVPNTTEKKPEHHYGRDAALVGAGAGTTAELYAAQRSNEPDSGPASSTIGPHKSNVANILDPRVQPDPKYQKHHTAAPTSDDPAPSTLGPHKSDLANIFDPRVLPDPEKQKAAPKQEHHDGRNAATAGAIGGLGAGTGLAARSARSGSVNEAAEAYDTHPLTQPSASLNEQRYDPSAPTTKAPSPILSTVQSKERPEKPQHHYGRDAAAAGGIGAAGAGAYAVSRGNDHSQESRDHDRLQQQSSITQSSNAVPQPSTTYYEPLAFHDISHRDPAAIGGLGVGAYAPAQEIDHSQQQPPSGARPYDEQTSSVSQRATSQPSGTQQVSESSRNDGRRDHDHNYGRNAAIAGGLGAAGAGAYAASRTNEGHPQQQPQQIPGTKERTVQPSVSQPLTTQRSPQAQQNFGEGRTSDHHYGRDAAVAGGIGAAGVGAYSASRRNEDYPPQQQQIPGTKAFAAQHSATQRSPQGYDNTGDRGSNHHYGRDAAIAGGLGATGAGAYAASHGNDNIQSSTLQQPSQASQNLSSRDPAHQRYDSVQDASKQQQPQQHDKRNLVTGAAAGAAVGAGGAYALSSQDDDAMKAQEQQLKDQQKAFEAQQKQQEKELHDQQKHAEKQAAKEKKEHDREIAKEERKHEKDLAAARKKEEKIARKEHDKQVAFAEEQQHERESEEASPSPKEKKHHLFPFLHRDKNKDQDVGDAEQSPRASVDSATNRKSREYEHPYSDTNSDNSGKRERHRLHKDPPKGHPAREAMEHEKMLHSQQHQDGRVTEPHTGLPMNIEKYGSDGRGGTDGSQTVRGYYQHEGLHGHASGQPAQQGGRSTTDWDKVREGDTIY